MSLVLHFALPSANSKSGRGTLGGLGSLGEGDDGPDPFSSGDPYEPSYEDFPYIYDLPGTGAGTRPVTATIPRTISPVSSAPSGQQSGLEKTISQIALTVAQAFGKRPVYNPAAVSGGGYTQAGSYTQTQGYQQSVQTAGSKGLGQDVGNTAGKLGDIISGQAARLVSAHPAATALISAFVVYEVWRKSQGHRAR